MLETGASLRAALGTGKGGLGVDSYFIQVCLPPRDGTPCVGVMLAEQTAREFCGEHSYMGCTEPVTFIVQLRPLPSQFTISSPQILAFLNLLSALDGQAAVSVRSVSDHGR